MDSTLFFLGKGESGGFTCAYKTLTPISIKKQRRNSNSSGNATFPFDYKHGAPIHAPCSLAQKRKSSPYTTETHSISDQLSFTPVKQVLRIEPRDFSPRKIKLSQNIRLVMTAL
jgi:hypothetical protein